MRKQDTPDRDDGLAVDTALPQFKPPPLYSVILLNDDYTPMDFVAQVLQTFFYMDAVQADVIVWHIHLHGRGICGVYTRDIAEAKVHQVNHYARSHQHPLLCIMEETT
jgi:ATP-dependent Clp protease adaptor protein ClpS